MKWKEEREKGNNNNLEGSPHPGREGTLGKERKREKDFFVLHARGAKVGRRRKRPFFLDAHGRVGLVALDGVEIAEQQQQQVRNKRDCTTLEQATPKRIPQEPCGLGAGSQQGFPFRIKIASGKARGLLFFKYINIIYLVNFHRLWVVLVVLLVSSDV